jgi:hypothetical protein
MENKIKLLQIQLYIITMALIITSNKLILTTEIKHLHVQKILISHIVLTTANV